MNILATLCNNTEGPNPLHTTAIDLHSVGGGLLVTNKGESAFPKANHYQGQLQTLQRVTVLSGKRRSTQFRVPCELWRLFTNVLQSYVASLCKVEVTCGYIFCSLLVPVWFI